MSTPPWPHAPPHFTNDQGNYMVTAATFQKAHHFRSRKRLRHLTENLLTLAEKYNWKLQAWAMFSNHYHFIAASPDQGANNLKDFINHLHSTSARFVNQLDEKAGRKVWHNYYESQITYATSYYARLHYVTANAVHHGLVEAAINYPWCSASWLKESTSKSFQKTIYSHKFDTLKIKDDF
jgi:putative transposase